MENIYYMINENNILIYNDVLEFDEINNEPKFFHEWCNRKIQIKQ